MLRVTLPSHSKKQGKDNEPKGYAAKTRAARTKRSIFKGVENATLDGCGFT
jgi:hypothetical protein